MVITNLTIISVNKNFYFKINSAMNNEGFVHDKNDLEKSDSTIQQQRDAVTMPTTVDSTQPTRDSWGKSIEFLMSCIAMSGNVVLILISSFYVVINRDILNY